MLEPEQTETREPQTKEHEKRLIPKRKSMLLSTKQSNADLHANERMRRRRRRLQKKRQDWKN